MHGIHTIWFLLLMTMTTVVEGRWDIEGSLDYLTRWQHDDASQQQGAIQLFRPSLDLTRHQSHSKFHLGYAYTMVDNEISDSADQASSYQLQWRKTFTQPIVISLTGDRQQLSRTVVNSDYAADPDNYQDQDRMRLDLIWKIQQHSSIKSELQFSRDNLRDDAGDSWRNSGRLSLVARERFRFYWETDLSLDTTRFSYISDDSHSRSLRLMMGYRVSRQQSLYLQGRQSTINESTTTMISSTDFRAGYRYKPNRVFSVDLSIGELNDDDNYSFSLQLKQRQLEWLINYQETITTVREQKIAQGDIQDNVVTELSIAQAILYRRANVGLTKRGRKSSLNFLIMQDKRTGLNTKVEEKLLSGRFSWGYTISNRSALELGREHNIVKYDLADEREHSNSTISWKYHLGRDSDLNVSVHNSELSGSAGHDTSSNYKFVEVKFSTKFQ